MNEDIENYDKIKERKWIIEVITEGVKSSYWKLLRQTIVEWLEDENGILDRFRIDGIHNEKDMELYNRCLDRIVYLKKFLNMNEVLINHNKTIMERLTLKTKEVFREIESFVKGANK